MSSANLAEASSYALGDGVSHMAVTRATLLSLTATAIALAGLTLALPVAAQGEPPNPPPLDTAPTEQSQQDKREAAMEKAEAEKAKGEAEKKQREAEKAKGEAEKQQQREAEKAKGEAEKQQQREAEKAKGEAEKQQQREAEKAKGEAEKQQKLDAAKAKEVPEPTPQIESDADKGTTSDKPKANVGKQKRPEAEKAQGEAGRQELEADKADPDAPAKSDADAKSVESNKDNPQQLPQADADRGAQGGARDGARAERRFEPKNEKQALEQLKQERVKADDEFEKARAETKSKVRSASSSKGETKERELRREGAENDFVKLRKQRRERVEDGGRRAVIEEPDKRVIVIEKDRSFVRHDETRRFARTGRTPKRERQKDGSILSIYLGFGGVEILNLEDEEGRLLRRSRRGADGRETVLVDNRRFYSSRPRGRYYNAYVDLPPPVVRIRRAKYIVDDDEASEEDIYEALNAPPIERLQRGYALEEVRQSRGLRERMRRVDLNAINFAFASWEVDERQYSKLERVAEAIRRILKRNPDEMFLIEGHTDAVGSDIDNLSLSDRRAESVAIILSDTFRVPPENLITQGYGEQYLKVQTEGPSRENRRVAVRRITPLLSRSN